TFSVEEFQEDQWVILQQFNNDVIYEEDVYAAYAQLGDKKGRIGYQAGLRFEYSDVLTELKETSQTNQRNYWNFFPSAFLTYEISKNKSFQLAYSRRISRPGFWTLLPFFGFTDARNLFTGNPNLNPEYTNSFEFSHLNKFDRGSGLVSIYYRHKTDVIQRILLTDSLGFSQRFPVNLGTASDFGLEFSGNLDLKKWWLISGNGNLYRQIIQGDFDGEDFDADTYVFQGRLSSKWKYKKVWSLQLSCNYRSPRQTTQGRMLDRYNIDLALAADMLKGNGTLTFKIVDMFNTRRRRFIAEGEDFFQEVDFQWRARQMLLTFNYRINQKKKKERPDYYE
ncbi:MAG: outer membrane beta-barrel family protein, partial [Flavobacteriales bacterium]|nr:outer membrane beta-barrel family protein [Flavobacteriales bacterium]